MPATMSQHPHRWSHRRRHCVREFAVEYLTNRANRFPDDSQHQLNGHFRSWVPTRPADRPLRRHGPFDDPTVRGERPRWVTTRHPTPRTDRLGRRPGTSTRPACDLAADDRRSPRVAARTAGRLRVAGRLHRDDGAASPARGANVQSNRRGRRRGAPSSAGPACQRWVVLPPGRHFVGRARSASVRVDDPAVELHHGVFDVDVDGLVTFTQLTGAFPASVDGELCRQRQPLQPGDTLCLGPAACTSADARRSPSPERARAASLPPIGIRGAASCDGGPPPRESPGRRRSWSRIRQERIERRRSPRSSARESLRLVRACWLPCSVRSCLHCSRPSVRSPRWRPGWSEP